MKTSAQLLSSLLFASASVCAEVISVDVAEWPSAEETVTESGWTVRGISAYKEDGGVTFDAVGDYAVSPVYPGCVTQLVIRVCSTRSDLARKLKATPVVAETAVRQWTMSCTPETKYVEQSFAWPLSDQVRQFRLQIEGSGNGNWRVGALHVYLDRVEAPHALRSDTRYSDALTIGWTPDARAVSSEFSICRVDEVAPTFTELERWNFSILTNDTGNPLNFEDVPRADELVGVSGECLNVQANSGGYLQAGNTKGAGRMWIELSSRGHRTALMRMYRSDADGTDGPITVSTVDAGGVTNVLLEPVLTTQSDNFLAELPVDAGELLIETAVKSRRIRVEDVRIVTDYVSGYVTTNEVVRRRMSKNEWTAKKLAAGDYLWRVRSFDAEGTESVWSGFEAATLDPGRPPRPVPGLTVVVR